MPAARWLAGGRRATAARAPPAGCPSGDGCEIVYEDVFASGRCTGRLADCINAADRDPGRVPVVRALVNQVCDGLLAATEATGTLSRLDACIPDLHVARLAPGGRLDRWYTDPPHPAWVLGGQRLSMRDLACREIGRASCRERV